MCCCFMVLSDLISPADVLVEFLLQLDEAVVALLCEGDVPQHCGHGKRSHGCSLHRKKLQKQTTNQCGTNNVQPRGGH